MKKSLVISPLLLLALGCTPKPKPSSPATRATKLEHAISKADSAGKAK